MKNNFSSLRELKSLAISIKKGSSITVFWPRENTLEEFSPEINPELDKGYETSMGIVSFVDGNHLYVVPLMSNVIDLLKSGGFIQKAMYVPFSNWDYPVDEKEKWEILCEMQRRGFNS